MPYHLARDIQTCRGHHAVLRELIERFPAASIGNAPDVRTALRSLETVLVRHLAFEDVRLYPALVAAEPEIAEKARHYCANMGDLRSRVIVFFEHWCAEGTVEDDPRAFAEEWAAVRTALERRISAEDDDLYEIAEHYSG